MPKQSLHFDGKYAQDENGKFFYLLRISLDGKEIQTLESKDTFETFEEAQLDMAAMLKELSANMAKIPGSEITSQSLGIPET